jgi:hypothetical protein
MDSNKFALRVVVVELASIVLKENGTRKGTRGTGTVETTTGGAALQTKAKKKNRIRIRICAAAF